MLYDSSSGSIYAQHFAIIYQWHYNIHKMDPGRLGKQISIEGLSKQKSLKRVGHCIPFFKQKKIGGDNNLAFVLINTVK